MTKQKNFSNPTAIERREFLQFICGTAAMALIPPSISLLLGSEASATVNKNPVLGLGISEKDELAVLPGLSAKVLVRWGDPINAAGDTFGFNNDYLACFPLNKKNPGDLLLWANHETPHALFVSGLIGAEGLTAEQLRKQRYSVGGSIVHLRRNAEGWELVKDSPHGRRVSGLTAIPFAGGIEIEGKKSALGTLANCAGGVTPWGSVLTCEENYDQFYGEVRYLGAGKTEKTNQRVAYAWNTLEALPPQHYGWVVEVNPHTGAAKKLVSLGRFSHEGATVVKAQNGRCAVYSGDDAPGEFLYKFIASKAGSLEAGTLYVANIESGRWLALDWAKQKKLREKFSSQLEVLIYARDAARLLGASPLDRPEDIERDPVSGAMFIALTNNPKTQNAYGSILRLEEKDNDPLALEFQASTFLLGGKNSGIACPDNFCFDRAGKNLWITSDMPESKGAYADFGNNSLFRMKLRGEKAGQLERVANGPVDCELTGPCFSPDEKTLFLSVQHPGSGTKDLAKPTSRWPDGDMPKPAVVAISGANLHV